MINRKFKRSLKLFFKASAFFLFVGSYLGIRIVYSHKAQLDFAQFFGGLGMFIFGMNMMSSSLQRIAGARLKSIISHLTGNPLFGMLTGTAVTALVQSSSATTVMIVGFVNAGLMTLTQAIGVILGANIGTTITGQLIAFKLDELAWPILAIGSALMLLSKTKAGRAWGEALLGFALLFLGMKYMGGALKEYRNHEVFKSIFVVLSSNRIMGVFAGLMVTLVVQSSSATVGLTMSLMESGAFGSDPVVALFAAIPVILGDNIGTCITAVLASIGTNTNAKRVALAHTMFNVLGTLIVLPLLSQYVSLIMYFSSDPLRLVANAHSVFNIANAFLFLPLVGLLKTIVTWMIPEDSEVIVHQTKIDKRMLSTPPIALEQAQENLKYLSGQVWKMFKMLEESLLKPCGEMDEFSAISTKIDDLYKEVDLTSRELNNFLVALAQKDLSEDQARTLSRILYIAKDIEIIASKLQKITDILREQFEQGVLLPQESCEELAICFTRTLEVFEQLNGRFSLTQEEADKLQQVINSYTLLDTAARNNHLYRIRQGKVSPDICLIFIDALRSTSSLLKSFEYITQHARNRF